MAFLPIPHPDAQPTARSHPAPCLLVKRCAAIAILAAPVPCLAKRVELPIAPPSTSIAYTVLAFGIFPIPAHFGRFHGTLSADPDQAASCDVHVEVEVASLQMADPARTAQALGPTMLDAARFPTMLFDGACDSSGVSGSLTLHGVRRPLHLEERRDRQTITSSGTLRRQDYGVDGMAHLVGEHVTIRFTTTVPEDFHPKPP